MNVEEEIRKFCENMLEHCDSIRVICTLHEPDGTKAESYGGGNWYAQRASVEEWLMRTTQQDQAMFIAEQINPPDDDSEAWKE